MTTWHVDPHGVPWRVLSSLFELKVSTKRSPHCSLNRSSLAWSWILSNEPSSMPVRVGKNTTHWAWSEDRKSTLTNILNASKPSDFEIVRGLPTRPHSLSISLVCMASVPVAGLCWQTRPNAHIIAHWIVNWSLLVVPPKEWATIWQTSSLFVYFKQLKLRCPRDHMATQSTLTHETCIIVACWAQLLTNELPIWPHGLSTNTVSHGEDQYSRHIAHWIAIQGCEWTVFQWAFEYLRDVRKQRKKSSIESALCFTDWFLWLVDQNDVSRQASSLSTTTMQLSGPFWGLN